MIDRALWAVGGMSHSVTGLRARQTEITGLISRRTAQTRRRRLQRADIGVLQAITTNAWMLYRLTISQNIKIIIIIIR